MADPGRFGSVEAAVPGLPPVGMFPAVKSSPSSEAMSVMREDIMEGACCEPEPGNGFGKELVVGEPRPPSAAECSIAVCKVSEESSVHVRPWGKPEYWRDLEIFVLCTSTAGLERGERHKLVIEGSEEIEKPCAGRERRLKEVYYHQRQRCHKEWL